MIKTGYSEPKLSECGGDITKEWFVGFRHTCPLCLVRKPYQVRMGINYKKTLPDRRSDGAAVVRLLKKSLNEGWNPHHETIEAYANRIIEERASPTDDIGLMPFNKALDFSLEKKAPNLTEKSIRCFTTAKKFAQRAAVRLKYYDMPVRDTKRRHIKELMDQMVKDRQKEYDAEGRGKKVTGNFYNKYRGYLGCIFSELVEFDAIEYNPCDRIGNKPKITTNIHRHATQKERDVIKSHLQLKCPQFYYYLLTEYHTGIRPNEIFSIRICDIDWFNQSLNIHPYEGGSKTRQSRKVAIPNVLMKHLKAMKLESVPSTHYLFSNAFRPGAERKKRDYATKLWKALVKDELGLEVSLYSFKGLGGEDKREVGIGAQAVSSQYGHNKMGTTLIYLHGEKDRMDRDIRERTRDL